MSKLNVITIIWAIALCLYIPWDVRRKLSPKRKNKQQL